MRKIACVCSFEPSSWVSCQKIVQNLLASYRALPDVEILRFNYHPELTEHQVIELAESLHDAQPDVIVILDHKPHPLLLFQKYFANIKAGTTFPKFVFHVFGDFTLYYKEWSKLEKLLQKQQVEFIAASDRQKHLIDKFLHQTSFVVPFPVEPKEFMFSEAERKKQRAAWQVKDSDVVFTFTGRLSRQKRIHSLLRTFADFVEAEKAEAHLFIYGITDSIGDNFVGKWEIEGEYFRKIHRLFSKLPLEIQERIHFMGSVPNTELRSVYNGADYLVNLSVHNDEDYGMSVAEALCTGLPAILTDWGGLASFASNKYPPATRYVPVKIGAKNKIFSLALVVEKLREAYKNPFTSRKELAAYAISRFGVSHSRDLVLKILETKASPFTEFTQFFKDVVHRHEYGPTFYMNKRNQISALYRKIYSSYARPD